MFLALQRRNVGLRDLDGKWWESEADQTTSAACRGLQTNHGVLKSIALVGTKVSAVSFTSLWLKR